MPVTSLQLFLHSWGFVMKNKTLDLLRSPSCWISSSFLPWLHFKPQQVKEGGRSMSSPKCALLHFRRTFLTPHCYIRACLNGQGAELCPVLQRCRTGKGILGQIRVPAPASHCVVLIANLTGSILTFICFFCLPSPRVPHCWWCHRDGAGVWERWEELDLN